MLGPSLRANSFLCDGSSSPRDVVIMPFVSTIQIACTRRGRNRAFNHRYTVTIDQWHPISIPYSYIIGYLQQL